MPVPNDWLSFIEPVSNYLATEHSRMLTRSRARLGVGFRRDFGTAFPNARRGLGRAVRGRFRSRGTQTTIRRKRQTSGIGVTTQHDERRIYTKHTMPRRKKKAWKKFRSKVLAVAEKDLGSRTVVFNKLIQFTNTTANNQGLGYMALYSGGGTGDSFMSDVTNMAGLENFAADPTYAAGTSVAQTSRWIFKSAVLDVTFRNTSTFTALATPSPASEAKLEVDVYEILSNKNWDTGAGSYSDITSVLAYGDSITQRLDGAGTGISVSLRGTTPWDLPAALSYWRLKILKKTKFFVPNGDTFTYQIRDPRRHVMMQDRMSKVDGGNCVGLSRHLLVVFKLVPGLTVGVGAGTYQENLYCGLTRKFFYKLEGASEDRDRWLNQ